MKTNSICILETQDGEIIGITTFSNDVSGQIEACDRFVEIAEDQELVAGEDDDEGTISRQFTPEEIDGGLREKGLYDLENGWSLHFIESL